MVICHGKIFCDVVENNNFNESFSNLGSRDWSLFIIEKINIL
uniref:Uncharacterized protein n=1 Tax=Escherichia coli TaxID=562 RepID=W0FTA7_ECOLX|nr:hypothetical protein [Escherichia coli]